MAKLTLLLLVFFMSLSLVAGMDRKSHNDLLNLIETKVSGDDDEEEVEIETDIDESTLVTLEAMLSYLMDLVEANENILDQLTADRDRVKAVLEMEVDKWMEQINMSTNLYNLDMLTEEDYEETVNDLYDQSISLEEEIEDIEVEVARVTADLYNANNNYLEYLVIFDNTKTKLEEIMNALNELLGEGDSKDLDLEDEETNEALAQISSGINKVKSFAQVLTEQQKAKLTHAAANFLQSGSEDDLNNLMDLCLALIDDMNSTATQWIQYQIDMMETTMTYETDLEDWDDYIDDILEEIDGSIYSMSSLIHEFNNLLVESESDLAETKLVVQLLEAFLDEEEEFYLVEYNRLQDEIVTMNKIYDIFAAEVYSLLQVTPPSTVLIQTMVNIQDKATELNANGQADGSSIRGASSTEEGSTEETETEEVALEAVKLPSAMPVKATKFNKYAGN